MAALDALIANRVLKPAGVAAGDVPVWNGTTFVTPTGTRDGTKFLRDDGSWSAISGAPTGAILPYSGAAAPTGWLLADGSAVSRSTYAALFALVATTYGVGDGSTTFNLPDLRGRMVAGYASGAGHADVNTLGASDGAGITARRPKHKHTAASSFTGSAGNTGTESADHVHNVVGNTGIESVAHTHDTALTFGGGATSTAGGGVGVPDTTASSHTSGTESANHTHAFNVNSGGRSAAHTHAFTPAGTVSPTVGPQTGLEPTDAVAYIVLAHIIKV